MCVGGASWTLVKQTPLPVHQGLCPAPTSSLKAPPVLAIATRIILPRVAFLWEDPRDDQT